MRIKKPTTKKPAMTPFMQSRIEAAIRRAWQMIAHDILTAVAENGGGEMTRAEVIEVVLDADHVESYGNDREAAAALRALSPRQREKIARASGVDA